MHVELIKEGGGASAQTVNETWGSSSHGNGRPPAPPAPSPPSKAPQVSNGNQAALTASSKATPLTRAAEIPVKTECLKDEDWQEAVSPENSAHAVEWFRSSAKAQHKTREVLNRTANLDKRIIQVEAGLQQQLAKVIGDAR